MREPESTIRQVCVKDTDKSSTIVNEHEAFTWSASCRHIDPLRATADPSTPLRSAQDGRGGFELLLPIRKPEACSYNLEHGEGQQNLPAEVHQLFIAEARYSSPHPNVKTEKTEDFDYEPQNRKQSVDQGALERSHQVAER